MEEQLPARNETLKTIYQALNEHVDDTGVSGSAGEIGVSSDTMRRRIRGTQPWAFEEVLDLARHQLRKGHYGNIARAIANALSPMPRQSSSPLLIPSGLREMLRLVGRITTEIAETLEDGRVDGNEAKQLLELFAQLDQLSAGLRIDLAALASERR